MYREDGNGANFALGLFAGAAIGAGLALLFAPKTGQETRELLGSQYRGLADKVTEATETLRQQARERGEQISSQLSDRISSATDRLKSTVDRTASATHTAVDRAATTANTTADRVSSSIPSV